MTVRKTKTRAAIIRRVGITVSLLVTCIPLLAATQTFVVIVPVADMYSKPDENSDVVSQAIYGSNVKMVEEAAGWLKIQTDDQYTGWVSQGKLRLWSNS